MPVVQLAPCSASRRASGPAFGLVPVTEEIRDRVAALAALGGARATALADYLGAFATTVARFRRRALLALVTELTEEAVSETLVPALPLQALYLVADVPPTFAIVALAAGCYAAAFAAGSFATSRADGRRRPSWPRRRSPRT